MYDKSKRELKDNKKYVVSKKSNTGSGKDSRNVRHVDKRLKKDKRSMKIKKNSGPSILPCGTTDRTAIQPEAVPLRTTCCQHSFSQALIQLYSFPRIPWALTFFSSLSTGTLSNAFAKSRYTTSTGMPLSTDAVTFSRKYRRLLVQDFPCIKPCWVALISLCLARCSTMSSFRIDYIILQQTGVKETGR